jgi:hypothetical protein
LPDHGFHINFWTLVISGRVFGLSSNQPHHRRRRENIIHYIIWNFLLQQDGLRAEERGRGAMYQKCVHIILEIQIERNVESYIDDVVVKWKKHGDLLEDLKESFNNLRKYKMMLNPNKYIFGVSSGKLLGYMVSFRGIDVNPTKVEAIGKLKPPRTRREIQKLADMMTTLNRFISKLGERGMSFYKLLHKADGFQWNDQAAC